VFCNFVAASPNQKYFRRQLIQLEAQRVKRPNSLEHKHPVLYLFYGHLFNAAKNYIDALNYYTKAYKIAPNDPLICFSLGLAHIQRAMQRKSRNRHEHVSCGLCMIFKYQELVNFSQESYYNLGRIFQHLELNHLAVEYYEKVFSTKPLDRVPNFSQEAAYNLSLIYSVDGSPHLANEILMKYCSF